MKVKYLFFSLLAAAFLTSAMSEDKTLEIGKMAPRIETTTGTNVATDANSEGKTRVISFWNPKNPASRITNKNLSRQYAENADSNVEFISICTDSDENLMKEVMRIDGVNPESNLAYSEVSPKVFQDYGVVENSRAFVLTPDGRISQIL